MNDCKYCTRSSQGIGMCKSTALWSNRSSDSLEFEGKGMWRTAISLRLWDAYKYEWYLASGGLFINKYEGKSGAYRVQLHFLN